jgi:hypothetical protein
MEGYEGSTDGKMGIPWEYDGNIWGIYGDMMGIYGDMMGI